MSNNALAILLGAGVIAVVIAVIIGIVCYVLFSYSHMKALKRMGYDKAWLAWIPYACTYACADAASNGEDPVMMFSSFTVPAMLFKLWWLIPIVLAFIPFPGWLDTILRLALTIAFQGCIYAKMYAALDGKSESEEQVFGCISGFLPIIAVIKFLFMK